MSDQPNYPSAGIPNDPPQRPTVPPPASSYGAPPPQPPKRNGLWWLPWVIVALLGGTVIYLLQNKNKIEDRNDVLVDQTARADSSYDAVNVEYQAALARLDDLVSQNEEMARQMVDKDGTVTKLKSEIEGLLRKSNRSAADNTKAQKLIKQLNEKTRGYEQRIAELEAENANLNTQVTTVARERDSTVTENAGLQQKVRLGAVLHASNIRLLPIDLRRNGTKEKETTKARRVDLIRVLFDIDENRIAESGSKDIYIRVINPDGQLVTSAAIGSGVTTGADGQPIEYTLQKQVMLNQNERAKDVSVDWNQSTDYQKGSYRVIIYNEGYQIGSGSVTLR
ncbi:MAG: hypothetical protein EOP52_05715 [Sphingobacteriales bacterium]|nr:MAG: hypothetical protein EOP52_05715 [Sphingobacteriales bacterium]